ncbi:MAG: molybdopterin-guanine dinucleotide biosynthesis protein B [Ferroplasma sp.]|uniref:molybdopterin-guanine dinucleotide biosynthesis protein B n=1 Tax=Ferroplasma sp. TaxID=2591003 RepID=UPI0028169C3D|nr:molybdopterin-guanine dinucleotide biosynthesis protein B [Ferroplasma sp.]WMT51005.1 MAG: molybdopterin-guanine dinucleotide biosynthesis protein B [Ferroplasma sp.]
MKIFTFFGSSSSGKTTVIENLISILSGRYKIVYIKDIPHDNISLDTSGKDTWIMENAGAHATYGLMPGRTYRMVRERMELDRIINENRDYDIIFIEGFRDYGNGTRFLVLGNEDYLKYGYNYIIKANNGTYKGECIAYPEEIARLLDIIAQ